MTDLVEQCKEAARRVDLFTRMVQSDVRLLVMETERLRDVIDCGCNAIHDAVGMGGGDLKRIDAVQRRMRREGLE